MSESLMERTRELLRTSGRSLPDIYVELCVKGETDISYFWLRKFSSGSVRDPSVNRVQRLYEHLTGNDLPV